MKKVLLLSLSLVLGFCAFAQQRVAKNDIMKATASINKAVAGKEVADQSAANFVPQTPQSVVVNRYEGFDYAATMWTNYDLQSNQYVANRMYQLPNGSVAVTATMSHQPNQTASDRGTGYNFFNGEEWGEEPEAAVEPFKTGWPSIAQWGENGEILLAHGNGHMQCFTRETAGEGDWQYMGALPDYPEGYPYPTEYPTWPRVITCGDNHNVIIAVGALQHQVSEDETHVHTVLWRSEDAQNWDISYGPLADLGYEQDFFSADDYCLAAYGHTVALLYSGCMNNSVWMFKSNNDGLTWHTTKVWADPYEAQEDVAYEDTLYRPMNGSVVVDKDGIVHVALNTFEMIIDEDNLTDGTYSYYYGRAVDGILYWNDTQEAPIQSEDGNPHHAARLWWPIPGESGYVQMHADSTKWIGFIPMYEGYEWNNDMFYHAGTEYVSKFYGASGHPALSCDPYGNLACAYSAPCTAGEEDDTYYFRHIYVSYRNVDNGYWEQIVDDITDPEEVFELWQQENLFTCAVPNTINPGEFWFSFQSDESIGFYWGSNATQTDATVNTIYAIKVIADPELVSVPENYDAVDVINGIYPNPATDYVVVNSAMDADATITIVNLVGQTVKQFNKNLRTGENTIGIDLKSGIYFCTISANGFNKTIKLVVK